MGSNRIANRKSKYCMHDKKGWRSKKNPAMRMYDLHVYVHLYIDVCVMQNKSHQMEFRWCNMVETGVIIMPFSANVPKCIRSPFISTLMITNKPHHWKRLWPLKSHMDLYGMPHLNHRTFDKATYTHTHTRTRSPCHTHGTFQSNSILFEWFNHNHNHNFNCSHKHAWLYTESRKKSGRISLNRNCLSSGSFCVRFTTFDRCYFVLLKMDNGFRIWMRILHGMFDYIIQWFALLSLQHPI